MILSLVITIFNAEEFIIDCLDSVLKQIPLDNVEVVLVNDGSTDGSLDLIHNYLNNQNNKFKKLFSIIEQENKGVSEARNAGVRESKGCYIGFLDSDDILEPNFFQEVLSCILENHPDIIQFKAYKFNSHIKRIEFMQKNNLTGLVEFDNRVLIDLFKKSEWFVCFRVYLKEKLSIEKFPIGRNYEDLYLIPKLLLNCENIYFINKELMGYRINDFSITNTISKENINDLIWVNHDIYNRIYINRVYIYPFLTSLVFLLSSIVDKKDFKFFYKNYFKIMSKFSKVDLLKILIEYRIHPKYYIVVISPIVYIFILYFKNLKFNR